MCVYILKARTKQTNLFDILNRIAWERERERERERVGGCSMLDAGDEFMVEKRVVNQSMFYSKQRLELCTLCQKDFFWVIQIQNRWQWAKWKKEGWAPRERERERPIENDSYSERAFWTQFNKSRTYAILSNSLWAINTNARCRNAQNEENGESQTETETETETAYNIICDMYVCWVYGVLSIIYWYWYENKLK